MADKAVVTQTTLDAIGQAIIAKGGATAPMTPAQMAGAIGRLGIAEAPQNDVCFYDPWGTRLYSYTLEEAKSLTELPPIPTKEGFVAQKWTHTLQDIADTDDFLDIGAIYDTDDGSSRVYLHFDKDDDFNVEQQFQFYQRYGEMGEIDWGDGSPVETTSSDSGNITISHKYSAPGDYVVSLKHTDRLNDWFGFSGNLGYFNPDQSDTNKFYVLSKRIVGIAIGSKCDRLFSPYRCSSLEFAVLSSGKTFNYLYGYGCNALKILIFDGSSDNNGSAARECYALIALICKGIKIGRDCLTQSSKIGRVSYDNTTITQSGLNSCRNITRVHLSDSITTINQIEYCRALKRIKFGTGLLTIDANSLRNNSGMVLYDFSRCIRVPTLSNINAFQNIPSDCSIVVPDALYDEWIAATNWSDASIVGHIVKASEYVEA